MNKRTESIMGMLILLSLLLHITSYFFWPLISIVNLYYVSIYFLMLNVGLFLMLTTRGKLMKYVSVGMFTFGGQFLFMEFKNPQDWSNVDIATLIFIGINSLLVSYLVDKVKNKQNANHTTDI